MKLEHLRNNSCEIGAICLQKTWLSNDSNISLLQIDGFTLIFQVKICSAHGGLSIYLNNKYDYKLLSINNVSNVWEGQFIEITGNTIKKLYWEIYIDHQEMLLRITRPLLTN